MPDLAKLGPSLVWFGCRPVLLQKPPCPTRSPTTDACNPPSGIIFPHCFSRTTHKRTQRCDPSVSRCPIWNALGPGGAVGSARAGWVGLGLSGWDWPCWMGDDEWGSPGGLCEGWQAALWGSPTSLSQAACGRRQQPGPH